MKAFHYAQQIFGDLFRKGITIKFYLLNIERVCTSLLPERHLLQEKNRLEK